MKKKIKHINRFLESVSRHTEKRLLECAVVLSKCLLLLFFSESLLETERFILY